MYDFLNYCVRDYMTEHPQTVRTDARLRELQEIFEQHDFNGVPVVDDENRLMGVVTKLDLLKAFSFNIEAMVPQYEAIMERTVATIMAREPITVSPDLPLTRTLQRIVEMRTKSFPVVEDHQRLAGIIAREDILRALRDATRAESPNSD